MPSHSLPILGLNVAGQRYSCHGCGLCCRDFTVQLRPEDLERLRSQGWAEKLGEPITTEFRGVSYLRQRPDGSCIFLQTDGKCRVHAEFGFENKPIACQLFPFHITPGARGPQMGLNFACQSVQENKGAALPSHIRELERMADRLPDVVGEAQPMLTDSLRASTAEVSHLVGAIDRWLARTDAPLMIRLDGLAWLAGSLGAATLDSVREKRFGELIDLLTGALPDELALTPIKPVGSRHLKLLRQAVFARTEDVKLSDIHHRGRWRITWSQLRRSRAFARGRGIVPKIGAGWPEAVTFQAVEQVGPGVESAPINDLITRYARASVLGGRIWGAGYYGWPVVRGLQGLVLNIAVVSWLARLHAAGAGRSSLALEDVRAAVGRVDRTSGRAKWLGGAPERLRLRFLASDHGLRGLLRSVPLLET